MNNQAMRFRVGLFVLLGLFLLAVLSLVFGGFPTFFKRHQQYSTVVSEAPGVTPGTPVRRSGIRIGQVERVDLDDETGQVRVVFLLEAPHALRRGDRPTVVHSLLGGDAAVELVPAAGAVVVDRTPLDPGAEVPGALAPDAGTVLRQTSELVPSTQETLNEIRKSLQHFERLTPEAERALAEVRDLARVTREMVPDLRRTNDEIQVTARNWGRLGERLDVLVQTNQDKLIQALDNLNETVMRVGRVFNDENQRNLSTTLKNVRAGSESLESISRNTDALLRESRQTVEHVNRSVKSADEVLGNLQQATRPLAERSNNIVRNLDESTEKLNRTLTETREFLRAVNQADGSLRRLLLDPSLYNNLNDAACVLARALPRVDRVLHDLEVFADKIARHPESLGVGGVVKPSSGLKEAPTSNYQWQRGH